MNDEFEELLDDIEYRVDEERGHRPPRDDPICSMLFYLKGDMKLQWAPRRCTLPRGHEGDHDDQEAPDAQGDPG